MHYQNVIPCCVSSSPSFSLSSTISSSFLSHSLSSSLLSFSFVFSVSLSLRVCCGRVVVVSRGVSCCVVVLCLVLWCVRCVVWCVCGVVWCDKPLKKPPCTHSKRPSVRRHHAHMCFNMCAWCRYTQGAFWIYTRGFWMDTRSAL